MTILTPDLGTLPSERTSSETVAKAVSWYSRFVVGVATCFAEFGSFTAHAVIHLFLHLSYLPSFTDTAHEPFFSLALGQIKLKTTYVKKPKR